MDAKQTYDHRSPDSVAPRVSQKQTSQREHGPDGLCLSNGNVTFRKVSSEEFDFEHI